MILEFAIPATPPELNVLASMFQGLVITLLAVVCFIVWRKTRVPHFGWWAIAFSFYGLRLGPLIAMLTTGDRIWLFCVQVCLGWTGVALIHAALAVSGRAMPERWRWALMAFPPVWSAVALALVDSIRIASVPAVVFVTGSALWTAVVLLRHRRPIAFHPTTILGITFLFWSVAGATFIGWRILSPSETPGDLLRAWAPWSFYFDLLSVFFTGASILLLVNAELSNQLQIRTGELEQFSRNIMREHESERRRLSRALHDETAQMYAGVKLQLGVIREHVAPELAARLDRVLGQFGEGIRDVRRSIDHLRPALLDDLGFLSALRSLVHQFRDQHHSDTTLVAPETVPVMREEVELVLYRTIQEALTNVSRHAPDSSVDVHLEVSEVQLVLQITDDGPGLSLPDSLARAAAAGRLGIVGMQERIADLGGTLQVMKNKGRGVCVRVELPIERVVDA